MAPQSTTRARLVPDQRRQQLIATAARMLSEGGVDRVQISDVATEAGVTRPVVYKFFPNRQALIVAVLEDFEADLERRFIEGFRRLPTDLADIARVFVDAVCDCIEDKGPGAWHLLDARGPDPEVARVGQQIMNRMIEPWRPRIAELTRAPEREVATVAKVLVAAGRAVLDRWIEGALTRDEAVRDSGRVISALLNEYSVGTIS